MDYLALAIAELGSISERRIYRLISGARNLPPFLVANPGLNSGFMIPQYAAASIVNQSKRYCWPTSCDSIPSSQGQEDHVSMGGNSATKLCRVVDNTERVLAIELFNAAQALDLQASARHRRNSKPGTRHTAKSCRSLTMTPSCRPTSLPPLNSYAPIPDSHNADHQYRSPRRQ